MIVKTTEFGPLSLQIAQEVFNLTITPQIFQIYVEDSLYYQTMELIRSL